MAYTSPPRLPLTSFFGKFGRSLVETTWTAESGGNKANYISQPATPLLWLVSVGCIRLSASWHRAALYLVSSDPHFPIGVTRCEFTGAGTCGMYKCCRCLPLLGSFDRIIDSIYVTTLKGVRPRSRLRQTSTEVRTGRSCLPTQFPNLSSHIRTSPISHGRCHDANSSGVVGMGLSAFSKVPWVN